MSLAPLVEAALAESARIVVDDRKLPLFKVGSRVREADRVAFFYAEVVDEELLAQGAPKDVVLQFILLPEQPAPVLARALEPCLVDHPRVQLTHSAGVPEKVLAAIQPAEPSELLPPLHFLPLSDVLNAIILVKEYSEGTPLFTWRKARGEQLKLTDVSDILETMSEAIASFHRRGFAHGALTPDSIVLQEYASPAVPGETPEMVWLPKLVDLGLARTLSVPWQWPSGVHALWAAPESFIPDELTDWRRADQLGLGAMLYCLWTDRVPFEAIPPNTPPELAADIRRDQIEALPPPRGNPQARALGVTPAMSAACMRAMSADPKDRFPSMDAFASALRAAAREAGRRAAGGEEELLRDSTSPGSNITSRFRLSGQQKSQTSPGASGPSPPPVPDMHLPTDPYPRAPDMVTDPGGVTRGGSAAALNLHDEMTGGRFQKGFDSVKDDSPAVRDPLSVALMTPEEITGGRFAGSKGFDAVKDDPATPAALPVWDREEVTGGHLDRGFRPGNKAIHELTPATPLAVTEVNAQRKTQILDAPAEADGEYPPHPDRDETTDRDVAEAFGAPGKWTFNYLAAVFMALWLATLAFTLVRGQGAVDEGDFADAPAAPAKGVKPARAGTGERP